MTAILPVKIPQKHALQLPTTRAASLVSGYGILGRKYYELNNHLGNVLATISDKRLQVSGNTTPLFTADIITAQDYYPFGMLQPGRQYTSAAGNYRYGFNGKENDNELKGVGNRFWRKNV